MNKKLLFENLEEIDDFAAEFVQNITTSTAIFLIGEMGAGKTTFAAALARALGIKERVVSPTFIIGHEYTSGRIPLLHIDAYKIITMSTSTEAFLDELEALDIETALKQGVVIFEWCEEIADLLAPKRVEIHIEVNKISRIRTVEVRYCA
ncbi:MAG: tRNA (adenosine(37)-N6)-threonylcarbamoyltransferase complex ATPase subunit type 1 TsaE [Candidatus Ancillula sp.]|jgi:tRNA threonylcarbamoyladenosine biosynthesis protein TsaE|nr:tRNA (adenosine(37)-N6)-threonylcarbamoyltransferase complex ATPase subunit type 1 TsaE [Candidatus Ancillula sp.]